jgi:hypothetical protein
MRSHVLLTLAASLAFLFAFSGAATAQTATVESVRFVEPFVLDDLHPCTGEPVEVSGFVIVTLRGHR